MNARFFFLSAAFLSFALCAPAHGSTPLFTETFDNNSGEWNSSSGAPAFNITGWTSKTTYKAKHAIRMGKTGGVVGSATTPSILIPSAWSKASVTVSFQAAAWPGYSSGLTLSKIENGLTTSIDSWVVSQIAANTVDATNNVADLSAFTSDSTGKPYTATFEARDSFQLVFATTGSGNNCRSYLDTVVVTAEEIVSSLTSLDKPTGLVSSNVGYFQFTLSWDSVLNATNGYTVTLSPAEGNVSVNDTTATVTGLAEGSTYTASVVANGDGTGTDNSEAATLSVTTLTAPAVTAPVLTTNAVSSSSFTVSWPTQNDADFSVRAWTFVPADEASENFSGYVATKTPPEGWVFENSRDPFDTSAYSQNPVDLKNGEWISSPQFGGIISNASFRVRSTGKFTGSFTVYGTTGSTNRADWVSIQSWEKTDETLTADKHTLSSLDEKGFTRLVFAFEKTAGTGNIAFGSFSVTGTGVGKARSYLTGYGSDAAGVPVEGTSVTISNPVAGKTNYVEVTATGRTGRTESKTISVPVPAASYPAVISVK